jgi:hypothetical protein
MPPRLNKRQQRELEELEALGGPSNAQVSSEDEAPIVNKPGVASFSNVSDSASLISPISPTISLVSCCR